MLQTFDYITIAVYLVFLMIIGWAFGRISNSTSDFVRGGGKATWWLVGSSSLMAGISAFTFTGAAAGTFQAGPTFAVIYIANVAAYLVQAFWFAPRFRQTRAYTTADVLRSRFGPEVEQFKAYWGLIHGVFSAAVPLWALAVFGNVALGIPTSTLIIILGIVVTVYSMLGGKWSVMGTDFVQCLVVISITVILWLLCLREAGGLGEFFSLFSRPDLAKDFAFVKEPGMYPDNKFAWPWIIAAFTIQFTGQMNLQTAGRYLSVRDGREASKAALFCAVTMTIGAFIWLTPPMMARALWADEIMAQPLSDPASASYFYTASKLLPNGLMGIMVVAMFSATLSSMDSGLNANAGMLVRNIVPALRRLFKKDELSDRTLLLMGRVSTIILGVLITTLAILYSTLENLNLFEAFLTLGSIVGLPLTIPMLAGLFMKKLSRGAFFIIFGFAMAPSVWSLISSKLLGNPWTYTERALWVSCLGILGIIIARIRFYATPQEYYTRVLAFFEQMERPLSLEEKGEGNDEVQARILGKASVAMGAFIFLLLLLPNSLLGRGVIASVGGFNLAVGGVLIYLAKTVTRRKRESMPVLEKTQQKAADTCQ